MKQLRKPYRQTDRKIYFCTTNVGGREHIVSPFAIANSKEELFNYLICEENGEPCTFRLTRLRRLILQNDKRSFKDKNIAIFSRMIQYGPQYIYDNEKQIAARLTDKGKMMFKKFYLHRPHPVRIEKSLYYFDCSDNQILQYFSRFGRYAFIEEPIELSKQMEEYYRASFKSYAKKNQERGNDSESKEIETDPVSADAQDHK